MKISELMKHLADILVADGDVDVYIDQNEGPNSEELVRELLIGRKMVIITSKDCS